MIALRFSLPTSFVVEHCKRAAARIALLPYLPTQRYTMEVVLLVKNYLGAITLVTSQQKSTLSGDTHVACCYQSLGKLYEEYSMTPATLLAKRSFVPPRHITALYQQLHPTCGTMKRIPKHQRKMYMQQSIELKPCKQIKLPIF